jgi:hypothetical protein
MVVLNIEQPDDIARDHPEYVDNRLVENLTGLHLARVHGDDVVIASATVCTGAVHDDGTVQHDGPTCPVHEAGLIPPQID